MKKLVALFAIFGLMLPFGSRTNAQVADYSTDNDWHQVQAAMRKTDSPQETPDTLLRANTDTLMKHVRILSSSQYEGRLAGSKAYLDAAEYCARVLASYGLKPYGNSWFENFEVEYNEIENCNFYTYVNDNDTRVRYVLGRDYVCGSMTGRGYTDAPVVFCGWGIDHLNYDEYRRIDAKGKIVLCLSGVPDFLPSKVTEKYATLRDKAEVARKHGAVGIVCINMSETCRPNEVQHHAYCGQAPYRMTFPVVLSTKAMGEALLSNETMTLDSVVGVLNAAKTPQSFHLRKLFEININAKYKENGMTCNVVGMLPGRDAKLQNEIMVVGAHLDHVGIQGSTCLFPGADDNASGVAAVLETARLLTTMAPSEIDYNKRTILFVLFSGGEIEQAGASLFVSQFPKLRNIECFVNSESIGSGDSIEVLGGKRFPNLWEVASRNDSLGVKALYRGPNTQPKGDATPFAKVGIPSIVFTNYQGNRNDHVPSDISENINRNLMTKNASLMAQVVYELSLGDYQGRSFMSKRYKFEE